MSRSTQIIIAMSIFLNVLLIGIGWWAVRKLGGWEATMYRLRHKGLSGVYESRKSLFGELKTTREDIIWLGDSLTEKGEWSELFGDGRHKNRGISGDYAAGVLERLPVILRNQPKAIFLMIGTNDLLMGMSPTNLLGYYRKVVEKILEESPDSELVIESVLPINDKEWVLPAKNKAIFMFNEKLQELAVEKHLVYVDLYGKFVDETGRLDKKYTHDGIHLNGAAYLVWKKTIDPLVEQL
ncbi:MAG TPA: sialate O-acetylesterase [Saprospiraceae bacterium]|nr:sialate O-acetylesterase [Saprospiraceae bacterium]